MYLCRTVSCFVLAAVVVAGCNQGEPLGGITGKVTFKGQPISEGLIVFSNPKKGVYMTAPINQDGTYVVTSAAGPGIPLGKYAVTVSPPLTEPVIGPMLQALPPKQYPNIPPRYRDPKKSELSLDVQEGENPFNVDMQP